jgi:uncharacterized integral membrane protein (TIGR00697 family)
MKKLNILLVLYISALISANLLWWKLLPIGDRGLTVSIIMFPFLFLITDIVWEVYWKSKAKEFVNLWLFSLVILLLRQIFSILVPGAVPNPWYAAFNSSYQTIFQLSIYFTIASILAFIIWQYVDVFIFHNLKRIFSWKYLRFRNNISTIIAQFIDSTIWSLIAFLPKLLDGTFTIFTIFSIIIIPYWLAKVIIAILETPICYLWVNWLKKNKDTKEKILL